MLKQKINLPEENVTTLNRNSIEDYILVPHAIKRAFPTIPLSEIEIQKFFEENKTKRNKKNVLDALFKRAGLGKYNAEKAAAIASAMTVSEIDPEIKSLLNDLSRIRGVN